MAPQIPMSGPRVEARSRVPELDGVRGLAILLVVLWHYVVWPLQGAGGPARTFGLQALRFFTISGVDLFFVLSGFLIGGILLDQRQSPKYFRAFYVRRFCRILPLYFLWLALYYAARAAAPAFAAAPGLSRLFQHPLPAWSYLTFTQNLTMAADGRFGPDWLGATWSLAVEEQFYLLLPLVIRFIAASRLPVVFAAFVVGAPLLRMASGADGFGAYTLMPCRADALLLGVLCAYAMRQAKLRRSIARNRPLLYGLMTISAGWLLGLCAQPIPEKNPLLASGFALLYAAFLLVAITESRGPVSRLVRQPWLRGLGLLAYGVYLIHMAVNGLTHGVILGRLPGVATLSGIAVTLLAAAITVSLAALSWWKLEKPIVAWGHTVRYEPTGGAGSRLTTAAPTAAETPG